jgi:hypothetical protein
VRQGSGFGGQDIPGTAELLGSARGQATDHHALNTTTNYCRGAGVPKKLEPRPLRKEEAGLLPTCSKETSKWSPWTTPLTWTTDGCFSCILWTYSVGDLKSRKNLAPMPAAALIAFITKNCVFGRAPFKLYETVSHASQHAPNPLRQHPKYRYLPSAVWIPGVGVKQGTFPGCPWISGTTTICFNAFFLEEVPDLQVEDRKARFSGWCQ